MGQQNQAGDAAGSLGPKLHRRQVVIYLLGFSVVATLGGVLTPIIGYLWPPTRASTGGSGRVEIGKTADFAAGQGKVIPVNDKPVIVVNTAPGGLRAFSAICTHLGCIVNWDETRRLILCPCHDGLFNPSTGAVISGPPPSPLPQLELTVEGDAVYVRQA
jgi:cytochrome b6-f complex iron-sulfur subunit